MVDMKGRWVLITGASRGVGREIARFMAGSGANLILHAREIDHLDGVVAETRGLGVEVVPVAAELGRTEEVRAMMTAIDAQGMPVDILFNNAAVQVAYRREYWQTPASDFETSFQINAIAPAMLCLHFIPPMIARGFGRVINTTSGIKNEPEQLGYAASKAALDKFTKDLAKKLDHTGVLLNIADPGWCRTDLGGPQAPNPVDSVLPGIVVGAFVEGGGSGRFFPAQRFRGMTLAEAVADAERVSAHPYVI